MGVARRAAPERRAPTASYSLACLEIAGDPQRVSEWLGESVEAPLEDVKVEWVAPNGTPGIIAAQIQTPTASSGSDARPVAPGRGPSPNIWHHTATYEVENRAVDPDGRLWSAMRVAAPTGRGRDVLDLGCGTGFHLPRFADDRGLGGRRRAAPRTWSRWPGGVPGRCRTCP